MWNFTAFTVASQSPPMCGALGGIKRQFIHSLLMISNSSCGFIIVMCGFIISIRMLYSSVSWRCAPTKFNSLSELILMGRLLLKMNLLNAFKKTSVVRSPTNSICTALVAKHTNIAIKHLINREFLRYPSLDVGVKSCDVESCSVESCDVESSVVELCGVESSGVEPCGVELCRVELCGVVVY